MQEVAFWVLGLVSVGSAFGVVTRRNPVYAALFLMAFFFSLAGLYALLAAPFIAVMQILVYVGAILVLFLFMIMLLDLKAHESGFGGIIARKGALATAFLLVLAIGGPAVWGALRMWPEPTVWPPIGPTFGDVATVGHALYSPGMVLAVELLSVLLLAAAIGAVYLAKQKDEDNLGGLLLDIDFEPEPEPEQKPEREVIEV